MEMNEMFEEVTGENVETVVDDFYAEKVLRRRADEIAERDRLLEDCDKMLEFYKEKKEEIELSYGNKISYDEALLRTYMELVPTKETDTQKSYKLPSGKLTITKAKQELVPNRENLVTFLEKAGDDSWIKVKKDVDWAALKKTIAIVDGKAVWEQTGEILDDVEVIEKPESFSIR